MTRDPVFFDSTGRRRRRVRLVLYGIGVISAAYTATVALSMLHMDVPISSIGGSAAIAADDRLRDAIGRPGSLPTPAADRAPAPGPVLPSSVPDPITGPTLAPIPVVFPVPIAAPAAAGERPEPAPAPAPTEPGPAQSVASATPTASPTPPPSSPPTTPAPIIPLTTNSAATPEPAPVPPLGTESYSMIFGDPTGPTIDTVAETSGPRD